MMIPNPHSLRADRYARLFDQTKQDGFSEPAAAEMVGTIALFEVLYKGLPSNVVPIRPSVAPIAKGAA